jgi:ribosome-associated protein
MMKSTNQISTDMPTSLRKALISAQAAIDKRSENMIILDLTGLSAFTEYFVICSGMSDRQVQSIADAIQEGLTSEGYSILSVEGLSEGRWVVVDTGDLVVHIFLDAIRDYYDLEALWREAPRVQISSEFYGPVATRVN